MMKRSSFLGVIIVIVGGIVGTTSTRGVLKGGFYKIESLSNHAALTTTWNGHPRAVITDEWKETGMQEWRARLVNKDGHTAYILRNEFVKDNEVNKEPVAGGSVGRNGKEELEPIDWSLIPVAGHELTFVLQSHTGCLKNNGIETRISVAPCDPTAADQQWKFEFLFDHHE